MGLLGTIWYSRCPRCGHTVERRRRVVSAETLEETRNQLIKLAHITEAALDALQEKDPFYADSLQDEVNKIKSNPAVRAA